MEPLLLLLGTAVQAALLGGALLGYTLMVREARAVDRERGWAILAAMVLSGLFVWMSPLSELTPLDTVYTVLGWIWMGIPPVHLMRRWRRAR